MRLSDRERTFWRRYDSTAQRQIVVDRDADLFREVEVAERRRHHLTLVIQRKARRLGCGIALADLSAIDETRLSAICLALSRRIAFLKRNAQLMTEAAA